MTSQQIGRSIRALVRQLLSLGEGYVRPAKQEHPTGGQCDAYATVEIIAADPQTRERSWESREEGDTKIDEVVDTVSEVRASVNFYRSNAAAADDAGVAKHSSGAFDLARELGRRMYSTPARDLVEAAGLSFIGASSPRDLSDLVDEGWESRGQIDLEFYVVDQDRSAIETIGSANARLTVQRPDGIIDNLDIEVSR